MTNRHYFKIDPEPFAAMRRGDKRADLRDLSDRPDQDLKVGDEIVFAEWDRENQRATNRFLVCQITHLQTGYWLPPNCVSISFGLLTDDIEWRREQLDDERGDRLVVPHCWEGSYL